MAALFALVGAAACSDASGGDPLPTALPGAGAEVDAPVVMAVRSVCRVSGDVPGAADARITGLDGSQSVVAGGTQYWFFGDTVRRGDLRQDVIPATIATTTDATPGDCLDLRFKASAAGAEPLFPRLDETTAWPDGVLALDDGSIVFYMVKAYRTSPFAWYVGGVGLGRIAAGSLEGERVVETIWDENSGFGGRIAGVRSPVLVDGRVVAYIRMDDGRNLVARAPLERIGEFAAYEYYDGDAWSADPADAAPMWTTAATGFPADNGVQVSFDERAGRWVAVYNADLAAVEVRTAEQPWGPWSAPVRWFDCRPLVREKYPYCYTGELHRQFDGDADIAYMTISSSEPYDVGLLELHLARPVHEWRNATGELRYAFEAPGAGYEDGGVAFYASAAMAPGLAPVYERLDGGSARYGLDGSTGGEVAFYVYSRDTAGAVPLQPVARVEREGGAGLAVGTDDVAFYVPCAGNVILDACTQ